MRLTDVTSLGLLGLLVPLWLLFFLAPRNATHVVSATWLWRGVAAQVMAHPALRRARVRAALLLASGAIVLAAFAAARPHGVHALNPVAHEAIVIDTSASMATREGDVTRMELAKREAVARLGRMHPDTEVLIVAAGHRPVTLGFHKHPDSALPEIAALRAWDVEGDLRSSLQFAADQLAGKPGRKHIVLLSDGVIGPARPLPALDMPVEAVRLGTPSPNLAVLRSSIRAVDKPSTANSQGTDIPPGGARMLGVTVTLLAKNFSPQPRDVHVAITQRNVKGTLATASRQFAAGEEAAISVLFDVAESDVGTGITAELLPNDALASDDRAYLVIPSSAPLTVWMYPSQRQPSLARAFAADPLVRVVEVDELEAIRPDSGDGSLQVLSGWCPTRFPRTDFVLVAPPAGPCLSLQVGPTVGQATVMDWDDRDLRLRYVDLGALSVPAAHPLLRVNTHDFSLARIREGTLIAAIDGQGRSGTVLGFDLEISAWPRDPSFVVFARNLVEYSRTRRVTSRPSGFTAGDVVELPLPSEATTLTLIRPEGDAETLTVREGVGHVLDTARAGHYFASWTPNPQSLLFAVNLESGSESDPTQRELTTTNLARFKNEAEAPSTYTDYSSYFALFAAICALFAALLSLPQRRPERA